MRASQLPPSVRVKSGTNAQGKQIHYLLNYSSDSQTFTSPFAAGTDLLTGKAIPAQTSVTLNPWDLIILEEN
ncbi:Beta-galactosidase C-terminal domain [Tunturiibacter lichenicola]|uniref:Beta-galactosidase C-terminal domain n=1 Tax=Tunturiibacter lichenicola TaxID=2051959 RepID=UPI003D9AFA38